MIPNLVSKNGIYMENSLTLDKFTLRELSERIKELPIEEGYQIIYRCEKNPEYPLKGAPDNYRNNRWDHLPSPSTDSPEHRIQQSEVCGCTTLKQFTMWWKKQDWEDIAELGSLLILEVPKKKIKKLKHQAVFQRHSARIVAKLKPKEKKIVLC